LLEDGNFLDMEYNVINNCINSFVTLMTVDGIRISVKLPRLIWLLEPSHMTCVLLAFSHSLLALSQSCRQQVSVSLAMTLDCHQRTDC